MSICWKSHKWERTQRIGKTRNMKSPGFIAGWDSSLCPPAGMMRKEWAAFRQYSEQAKQKAHLHPPLWEDICGDSKLNVCSSQNFTTLTAACVTKLRGTCPCLMQTSLRMAGPHRNFPVVDAGYIMLQWLTINLFNDVYSCNVPRKTNFEPFAFQFLSDIRLRKLDIGKKCGHKQASHLPLDALWGLFFIIFEFHLLSLPSSLT